MKIEMAPCVRFENLENLYLELVPKNIDLRKKRPLYLSKEKQKQSKLLSFEAVKEAFKDVDKSHLKHIYLIGSEPMFNPDFNKILRYCIKFVPTTIVSCGQNINEKKARFLYKIQQENEKNFEINFIIKLYHFDERENDTYCQRGDFRKIINGINCLQKYEFYPEIKVINVYHCEKNELLNGFNKIFSEYKLSVLPEIKIANQITEGENEDIENIYKEKNIKDLNCIKSRVLTSHGVFSCPILSGDNRARVGSDLKNFSQKNYLETKECVNCMKN